MLAHQEKLVSIPKGISSELYLGFYKEFGDDIYNQLLRRISQFFINSYITDSKGCSTLANSGFKVQETLGLAYTSSSSYAGFWICNGDFEFGEKDFYLKAVTVGEGKNVYFVTWDSEENEKVYYIGALHPFRDDGKEVIMEHFKETLKAKMEHSLNTKSSENDFTINRMGETEFSKGYAVSFTDNILTEENFDYLLNKAMDWLFAGDSKTGERIVGIWTDEGKTYFDFGKIYERYVLAVVMAVYNGQKAIYGFGEKEVISLCSQDKALEAKNEN